MFDFKETSRSRKYEMDEKYKKKLRRKAIEQMHSYGASMWPVDKNGDYCHNIDDAAYIKRDYRGSRSKYLKRLSNKKVRRYDNEELPDRNGYRKVFDFWWEMY